MNKWTIVCCLLAISSGLLVHCHPSGSFSIQYYGDSEKPEVAARTPLRIVPKPDNSGVRKNRGSITYFSEFGPPSTGNELIKEVYPVPQGGFVPIVKNRGLSRYNQEAQVTKIQPVPKSFDTTHIKPVVEEPEADPIQQSLAASPLRLLPVEPQSFGTIRSEVQAIKNKHKKYFGESDYVDEYARAPISVKVEAPQLPVALVPPNVVATPLKPSVHYNFEQSFGDTKWPIKKASPIKKKSATISKSAYTIDGISDRKLTIDKLAKLDKYRLKSEESDSDESDSNSDSSSSEEDGTSSSSEEDSSEEGVVKESSNESQKESQREDEFPVNYYAQTRLEKSRAYLPAPQNDPRITEKISTKKTNIVYSEQGYNDKSFDHGKSTKLYEVHQRYRRDLADKAAEDEEEIVEEIEALPIPLALQQQVNGSNLNGEELLSYVQEVIKNSSKYLPDDINEDVDDSFTSLLLNSAEIKKLFALPNEPTPNASEPIAEGTEHVSSPEKYPFLNLPESDAISKTSALRYAENPAQLPKTGRSYYDTKNTRECDEIEPEIDHVPEATQNGVSYKPSPDPQRETRNKKRLKNLDKKIICLKKKQFGENPLDNPLFKEEFVDSDSVFGDNQEITNAKVFQPASIGHPLNPSINVYDDVISNIRLAIVAENANLKDRNRVEILKLKPKALDAESSESSNVNQTVVSVGIPLQQPEDSTKDGIFDISKYLPRIYYEPKDGVLYRVRYKKKKKKKKKNGAPKNRNIRHNPKYSDYTVFPRLEHETKPDYFNRESKFNYDAATEHSPVRSNKILHAPSNHHPKTLPHPIHSLSSGYYPYPVLAVRRKRFHYELIGNSER